MVKFGLWSRGRLLSLHPTLEEAQREAAIVSLRSVPANPIVRFDDQLNPPPPTVRIEAIAVTRVPWWRVWSWIRPPEPAR